MTGILKEVPFSEVIVFDSFRFIYSIGYAHSPKRINIVCSEQYFCGLLIKTAVLFNNIVQFRISVLI